MNSRRTPTSLTAARFGSKFLTGHRIAQQHARETVHLSAQFLHCAHWADMVGHADGLIQRRIQPVRVAGQPIAEEGHTSPMVCV